MWSQSGEPASFLGFGLGECGGGIGADEAGLFGVEGAGPQPGSPRCSDVAIGPGVPGRALVGGLRTVRFEPRWRPRRATQCRATPRRLARR
jgi:hypothetical protein